jgi:Heterokaryon incompatibility protein (HET)
MVDLHQNPAFMALSYAWGAPGDVLNFACSGEVLRVHENLGNFLHRARLLQHQMPIWIDAICINQADDAEKNNQIPIMGEIYSKASQVIVWLGDNTEEQEEAFASIPRIANALDEGSLPHDRDSVPTSPAPLGIPHRHSRLWDGIMDLLSQPWFSRLWIMQEVLSNSNICVLCGGHSINWDDLVDFVYGLIKRCADNRVVRIFSDDRVRLGLACMISLGTLKDHIKEPDEPEVESNRMSYLLNSMIARLATKPVDKIYGILGMMPSDILVALTVDVNMTHAQVFAAFTRCLFKRGDASLVLCYASHSMTSEQLPLWCPNYAEASATVPIGALSMITHFAAGHKHEAGGNEKVRLLQDWNKTEVTGFIVDVVSERVNVEYMPSPPPDVMKHPTL